MNKLVIDPGFGHTKVVKVLSTKIEQLIFPSLVGSSNGPLIDSGLSSPHHAADLLTFDDQSYILGESALGQALYPQATLDRSRILSSEVRALVLSALARAYPAGAEGIHIYLTLPDEWMSDRQALQAQFTGNLSLAYGPDARPVTYEVVQVSILPQALSAYISAVFTFGSNAQVILDQKAIFHAAALVCEIGYKTANIAALGPRGEYRNYNPRPRSVSAGAYHLVERARLALADEYSAQVDRADISRAFKAAGKIHLASGPIDLFKVLAPTIEAQAALIVSELRTAAGSGQTYQHFLIRSGGAGVLGKAVAAQFAHPNTILASTPDQFDVALGAAMWAKRQKD